MVSDTQIPLHQITCARCPESIAAPGQAIVAAHSLLASSTSPETRADADDLDEVVRLAAARTAVGARWERDYSSRPEQDWLCPTCAAQVKAERTSPCPSWCNGCTGHDLWAEGTLHTRSWLTEAGDLQAEVVQHVDADGSIAWTQARLYDVAEDFTSLDELLAIAQLVEEVATFVQANGLVLDGGE